MEIIRIGIKFSRIQPGDIGKGLVRRGRHLSRLGELLALSIGFLRPLTGNDEICASRLRCQIQRQHGKLGRRTALKEQNFIVLRNLQYLPQQRGTTVDDGLIGL